MANKSDVVATAASEAASSEISSRNSANNRKNIPQWREAVAGASSGAISRTLLAPVERVKLLKQLQGSVDAKHLFPPPQPQRSSSKTLSPPSAWQVAATVYREQGLLSFWRGNVPNVLRVSGTAAVNFTCMDYYKRVAVGPWLDYLTRFSPQTRNLERQRQLATSLVSGGLAGATATTVLYPIEFLRTRLAMDMGTGKPLLPSSVVSTKEGAAITGGGQSSHHPRPPRQYKGMLDVLQKILKSDGILGLFQGYGIAVTGGIFYRIILLGGYDALKGELLLRKQEQAANHSNDKRTTTLSWGERIVSAQLISLTAGTAAYPFDSVRRRMMMQAGQPYEQRKFRNSLHCIRSIWRLEGIRGFYLGLGPNILRSVSGALLLVGYDRIRTLL